MDYYLFTLWVFFMLMMMSKVYMAHKSIQQKDGLEK